MMLLLLLMLLLSIPHLPYLTCLLAVRKQRYENLFKVKYPADEEISRAMNK